MVEPIASDIKDGIIEMIDSKERWKKMSENAILLIKKNFNWELNTKELIRKYEKFIQ